jgi:hypothetical protein
MSLVVGLPNNSYKPITNTVWVRARLCKLKKGCTRLAAASDKVYQLLSHGRWFSPGTPASSTTKTGCYDIVESGVKHQKSINQSNSKNIVLYCCIAIVTDNRSCYLQNTQTIYSPEQQHALLQLEGLKCLEGIQLPENKNGMYY